MRTRRFFELSMGILALSIAYHLGVSRAVADSPPPATAVAVAALPLDPLQGSITVISEAGDVYVWRSFRGRAGWHHHSNAFTGTVEEESGERRGGRGMR